MKNRNDEAVLFLDVDGTISPLGEHTADSWGDQVQLPDALFGGVLASPALLRELGGLGVPIVWVTDWEDPTPTFPPSAFGVGHRFEFLVRTSGSGSHWWKSAAVLEWLAAHPEVRHVLWCDDHLRRKDSRAGTRAEVFTSSLRDAGRTALTIAPSAVTGLTPAHLKQLREHLMALTSPDRSMSDDDFDELLREKLAIPPGEPGAVRDRGKEHLDRFRLSDPEGWTRVQAMADEMRRLDEAYEADVAAGAAARMARDHGPRYDLDEVMRELGFDRAETEGDGDE